MLLESQKKPLLKKTQISSSTSALSSKANQNNWGPNKNSKDKEIVKNYTDESYNYNLGLEDTDSKEISPVLSRTYQDLLIEAKGKSPQNSSPLTSPNTKNNSKGQTEVNNEDALQAPVLLISDAVTQPPENSIFEKIKLFFLKRKLASDQKDLANLDLEKIISQFDIENYEEVACLLKQLSSKMKDYKHSKRNVYKMLDRLKKRIENKENQISAERVSTEKETNLLYCKLILNLNFGEKSFLDRNDRKGKIDKKMKIALLNLAKQTHKFQSAQRIISYDEMKEYFNKKATELDHPSLKIKDEELTNVMREQSMLTKKDFFSPELIDRAFGDLEFLFFAFRLMSSNNFVMNPSTTNKLLGAVGSAAGNIVPGINIVCSALQYLEGEAITTGKQAKARIIGNFSSEINLSFKKLADLFFDANNTLFRNNEEAERTLTKFRLVLLYCLDQKMSQGSKDKISAEDLYNDVFCNWGNVGLTEYLFAANGNDINKESITYFLSEKIIKIRPLAAKIACSTESEKKEEVDENLVTVSKTTLLYKNQSFFDREKENNIENNIETALTQTFKINKNTNFLSTAFQKKTEQKETLLASSCLAKRIVTTMSVKVCK